MFDWRKKITVRGWADGPPGSPTAVATAGSASASSNAAPLPVDDSLTVDHIREGLSQTIEAEIIPRLMLTHHFDGNGSAVPAGPPPTVTPEDLIELSAAVLRDDGTAADILSRWMESGADFETVALELLAPTAGHLGQLWEADLLDFTDVTIGTWRLQQLMQQAALCLPVPEAREDDPRKRILLLATPGEQHSFGISMVAEFFRRDGWELTLLAPSTAALIERTLETDWFAVVAVSVSTDVRRNGLPDVIKLIRKASCNRTIAIMLGGRAIGGDEDFARLMGADTTSVNARDALNKAQFLLTKVAVLG